MIVVARLAAHVDHAVDRRAAAEHAAARVIEGAAIQPGLGLGLEAPIGARIVLRIEIADRHMDPDVIVAAAGLEQQHADVGIGRQPVGEHAPGAAGADDDIVECAEMPAPELRDRHAPSGTNIRAFEAAAQPRRARRSRPGCARVVRFPSRRGSLGQATARLRLTRLKRQRLIPLSNGALSGGRNSC